MGSSSVWMGGRAALAVSLVCAAFVGACGGSDSGGDAAKVNSEVNADNWTLKAAAKPFAGTELRVLDEQTDLQPSMAKLIPQFESESGIKVKYELESHPDVIRKGEADMLSGRGAYDVVMVHTQQAGRVLTADAIQYLDDYYNNPALHDPSVKFEDLIQPTTDTATLYQGKRLAFPNWNYNLIWWGRGDLIEDKGEQQAFKQRYGRELAPPKTLPELHDFAEFFTRKKGEKLAGKTLSSDFPGFAMEGAQNGGGVQDAAEMVFLNQYGGGILDADGKPAANRPENVEAMKAWGEMWKYGPAGQAELSIIDMPVVMGQGSAASGFIYSDFAFSVDKPGESPYAGKFVYAPTPSYNGKHVTSVQPGMLMISKASKNKEAAYLLLQWMASQKTQDLWMESGVAMPMRESSFDAPAATSGPRAGLFAAVKEAYAAGKPWPNSAPKLFEIFDAYSRMQQLVGQGKKSPEDALNDLQNELTDICGGESCVPEGAGS